MKCYVLTISKTFPAYHPRKGKLTHFRSKIESGDKKHTIRDNYELWKKRIDEVNDGLAYLSIREWTGKPYASKQVETMQKHKGEVGIQCLEMNQLGYCIDGYQCIIGDNILSINDGLSLEDFTEWFKGKMCVDMPQKAIIHFSDFRY